MSQWLKPVMAISALMLLVSLVFQGVEAFTPGAAPYYLIYVLLDEVPVQTGVWSLGPSAITDLMSQLGLAAAGTFGAAGGVMASLRLDAAGLAYLFLLPWKQLPVSILIQVAVFLLSTPLIFGGLSQLWRVLQGKPAPLQNIFAWYLDLRFTAKAVGFELLLGLWEWVTRLACTLPGLLLMIAASQGEGNAALLSLSLLFILGGAALGYFLYLLLLPGRYLLARSPELSAIQAFRLGVNSMKGRRRAFFLFRLSFLPWYLASMFCYRIPDLYLFPYLELSTLLFLTTSESAPSQQSPLLADE